jgi:hypothetical protein
LSFRLFCGLCSYVIVWLWLILGHWFRLWSNIVVRLEVWILDTSCCRSIKINPEISIEVLIVRIRCLLPTKEIFIDSSSTTTALMSIVIIHHWMSRHSTSTITVSTFDSRCNRCSSLTIQVQSRELIPMLRFSCCYDISELISQWSTTTASSKWIVLIKVIQVFYVLDSPVLPIHNLLIGSLCHLCLELFSICQLPVLLLLDP